MKSGNYQTTIDMESVVDELMASCQSCETVNKRSGCMIPCLNEQDEPDVVCIGPYYHDLLHWSESEKRAVLLDVLAVDEQQKAAQLTRLVNEITAVENEARDHYFDRAKEMSSREFVQMLLLDGCYILGKFVVPYCCPGLSVGVTTDGARSPAGSQSQSGSEDMGTAASQSTGMVASHSGSAMRNIALVRDVFYLLDNQIPFCVLDTVHKVLHVEMSSSTTAVPDTLVRQLRELLQQLGYSFLRPEVHKPWHLLHLLRMHFQPTTVDGNNKNTKSAALVVTSSEATACVYRWLAANQYHNAGVRFKKRHLRANSSARCILDVKLDGLTLRVPSLTVDNNTCRILRNMMELEQHNPEQLGSHVTAYCLFMSQLAGTTKDVELLVKKGIIVHALPTDSAVAEVLASLCSGITIDLDERRHNYLHKTRKALERMYQSRKVNWMTLPQRNPWLVVALLSTIVTLLCQLFQVIYTIKSYYRRESN